MNKAQFLHQFHLYPLAKAKTFNAQNKKQAAVLVPIFEKNNQLHIVLTLRAAHLRHHANQVSFPGGKVDPTDKKIYTAQREAYEEIGLPFNTINIIGQLNSFQTGSGYNINPIVGMLKHEVKYQINPNEVAEIFSIPLKHFLNTKNHFTVTSYHDGHQRPITVIPYQDKNIWGATAAILKELATHLLGSVNK